jgi:hypothetical protein
MTTSHKSSSRLQRYVIAPVLFRCLCSPSPSFLRYLIHPSPPSRLECIGSLTIPLTLQDKPENALDEFEKISVAVKKGSLDATTAKVPNHPLVAALASLLPALGRSLVHCARHLPLLSPPASCLCC